VHFNRIAVYGLIANLLTVPVMGSLIIPAAVVAALLWPLGLSWLAFAAMEPGLAWILDVAARVADMPGAVRHVATPPALTLAVVTVGGLVLIVWRGPGRWVGAPVLVLAGAMWGWSERPDILISDTGGMVGVMTAEGRALSRPRGDGFVARVWLENDGDGADQETAATRDGWREVDGGMALTYGGLRIWHGAGRRALGHAAEACRTHDIVVLSQPAERADPPIEGAVPALPGRLGPGAAAASEEVGCVLFDASALAQHGAVALEVSAGEVTMRTALAVQGARLWTGAGGAD
jgi:competence protein ComEC